MGFIPMKFGLYKLVPCEGENLTVEIVDGGREKEHRADYPPEVGHFVLTGHNISAMYG